LGNDLVLPLGVGICDSLSPLAGVIGWTKRGLTKAHRVGTLIRHT
jgi:hypothetical protein